MSKTTTSDASSREFQHLLSKARQVIEGSQATWEAQSTGERLAIAIVLNRWHWLKAMNFSIAEAMDRIGPSWCAVIPDVAKLIAFELEQAEIDRLL